MKVAMIDERAVFPAYLVRTGTEEHYCYFDYELRRLERDLKKKGIDYTVEAYAITEPIFSKVDGVKYGSRTEILEHLEKDVEPETMKVVLLSRKLEDALSEIASLKAERIATLSAIEQLQGKVATLESLESKESAIES